MLWIKFSFLCQLPTGFTRFPPLTLVISRIVLYPDKLLGLKAYLLCSRIRELYLRRQRFVAEILGAVGSDTEFTVHCYLYASISRAVNPYPGAQNSRSAT